MTIDQKSSYPDKNENHLDAEVLRHVPLSLRLAAVLRSIQNIENMESSREDSYANQIRQELNLPRDSSSDDVSDYKTYLRAALLISESNLPDDATM